MIDNLFPFDETEGLPVGWYPVLLCWDPNEGIFPNAAYWDGTEWKETIGPVNNYWRIWFATQAASYRYAYDHDPEW